MIITSSKTIIAILFRRIEKSTMLFQAISGGGDGGAMLNCECAIKEFDAH
jgi:hypothetical protein